jgi:hypothetical protein
MLSARLLASRGVARSVAKSSFAGTASVVTLPWQRAPATTAAAPALLRPTATLLAPSNRKKKFMPKLRHDGEINPLAKATTIDPKVLYVVSVPIGNLKDFTLRALDVLRQVDYIICSDRAATRVLLDLD